jgi:hypothetical protein
MDKILLFVRDGGDNQILHDLPPNLFHQIGPSQNPAGFEKTAKFYQNSVDNLAESLYYTIYFYSSIIKRLSQNFSFWKATLKFAGFKAEGLKNRIARFQPLVVLKRCWLFFLRRNIVS